MRNFWVYDSGAWVKPSTVFAGNNINERPAVGSAYRHVSKAYIAVDGEWVQVLDQFVDFSTAALSLLGASVGKPVEVAYWNVLIGGRKLGDLNNDGLITSGDALNMTRYSNRQYGSMSAGSRAWVEQYVIPYITENPLPPLSP